MEQNWEKAHNSRGRVCISAMLTFFPVQKRPSCLLEPSPLPPSVMQREAKTTAAAAATTLLMRTPRPPQHIFPMPPPRSVPDFAPSWAHVAEHKGDQRICQTSWPRSHTAVRNTSCYARGQQDIFALSVTQNSALRRRRRRCRRQREQPNSSHLAVLGAEEEE